MTPPHSATRLNATVWPPVRLLLQGPAIGYHGRNFANYLELHREAGDLYDQAIAIQASNAEAYHRAALVWQQAGGTTKAEMYRKKATGCKSYRSELDCGTGY